MLETECDEGALRTCFGSDDTKLVDEDSLTDGTEIPPVLREGSTRYVEMDRPDVEKDGVNFSPMSVQSAVTELGFDAVASSFVSHCSTDSGIYSKAVSNSPVKSSSTISGSFSITADLLKSRNDKLFSFDVPTTHVASNGVSSSPTNGPEALPVHTTEERSTADDDDDDNTMVDVRSSVMSSNADDTVSLATIEADQPPFSKSLIASVIGASSEQLCRRADDESETNGVCPPAAAWGVSDGDSQELSDSDDDAVLKTVVAVRTKAVGRAERVETMTPLDSSEVSDVVGFPNDCSGVELGQEVIYGEVLDKSMSAAGLDANSQVQRDSVKLVRVDGGIVNSLLAKNVGEYTEGDNSVLGLMHSGNSAGQSHIVDEVPFTLSAEGVPQRAPLETDTSLNNQTSDQVADSFLRRSHLTVGETFSDDDGPRTDGAASRPRRRTRSFANDSEHSMSCPEIGSRNEWRLSSTPPPGVTELLGDLLPEQQAQKRWEDVATMASQVPLTASMEDLKIRPSKKKTESGCILTECSQLFFLEPPDEYRDHPLSTENRDNSVSPNVTALSADASVSAADFNLEAKREHLQRYLKSLAIMPGCDMANEVRDSFLLQNGRLYSADVSYIKSDGEDDIELKCHECTTSVLVPDLLQQSDGMAELTEDDRLELQLQQYEVMKSRLVEEHRRSLECLLAEQEQQMALLQSQLIGQTVKSCAETVPPVLSTLSSTASERIPLETDIPDALSVQNGVHLPYCVTGGLEPQAVTSPHHRVPPAAETSGSRRLRSPAGVFYSDQQVISRHPSCSTIRSEDTESESAYRSPAVLRSSGQVTASPTDLAETAVGPNHHSVLPAHDSHLHSSSILGQQPVHGHRANRRFVDMFAEVSIHVVKTCDKIFALIHKLLCFTV